ncbi:hypothetical protein Nepgr_015610 [Nepenthes gracilis]|uniref:Pectinesterase inhibitor domain-containing protein n=1 Tax=Nepenthes gracilis TaxID=150966 RepID=A0AAD3XR94_NEPGR|nr:hypothetical protein Nepgr_015610 [Nepenthes gracilis]
MSPSSAFPLRHRTRGHHRHHLLLFISLLLSSSSFTSAAGDHDNLIHQTCKASSTTDPNINYTFCVNALQAAPASRCARLPRLGLLSLRLARDNATDTRCYIRQYMKSKAKVLDPRAKAALDDCLELYSDSIATLLEAMQDYRAKRFADVNVKVSSVIDGSDTCEDGFTEGGIASPLSRQNNFSFQLSAMVLSIVNKIQFH